jgi:hypothetical protein
MAEQSYTLEQSRQQAARLLADAKEHVAQEAANIVRLKGELAGAYNRRNQWEAEVRRLTPIKRTRRPAADQPTIEDLREGGGSDETH